MHGFLHVYFESRPFDSVVGRVASFMLFLGFLFCTVNLYASYSSEKMLGTTWLRGRVDYYLLMMVDYTSEPLLLRGTVTSVV